MVSRSLEKMMLIAIGLTTAVIIGVPVLLYAIDTMTTTQQIQYAHQTADTIFNATQQVDSGDVGELTIQVYVPSGFSLRTDESGSGLTVMLDISQSQLEHAIAWTDSYNHQIVVSFPTEPGNYYLTITLMSDIIHITYSTTPN